SALGAVDSPLLDASKVGRLGPRIWKAWIDADLEVNSVLLQVNDELGFFRLPFRTEARVLHPRAVKRAARGRPVRVDVAALSRNGVPTPHTGGLLELFDVRHLAAHHAGSAGPTRHQLGRRWRLRTRMVW